MDDRTRSMLIALGPGGTTELAERALAFMDDAMVKIKIQAFTTKYGGYAEVARFLGVSRQTLGHWIAGRRGPGGFPEPAFRLDATPVWNLADVARWPLLTSGSVSSGSVSSGSVGVVKPSQEGT